MIELEYTTSAGITVIISDYLFEPITGGDRKGHPDDWEEESGGLEIYKISLELNGVELPEEIIDLYWDSKQDEIYKKVMELL